jgi:hypothetical protein
MFLNVHSIFRQIVKSLEENEYLKNKIDMDDLKADLAI